MVLCGVIWYYVVLEGRYGELELDGTRWCYMVLGGAGG